MSWVARALVVSLIMLVWAFGAGAADAAVNQYCTSTFYGVEQSCNGPYLDSGLRKNYVNNYYGTTGQRKCAGQAGLDGSFQGAYTCSNSDVLKCYSAGNGYPFKA